MIPLQCLHGIPIHLDCAACDHRAKHPKERIKMELQAELDQIHSLIDAWRYKMTKAISDGNLEDASFFARAVGNEYERLSRALHDEWKRTQV